MSELKRFNNITKNDIAKKGVQALADRPNATGMYGDSGMSAAQLKLWFDKLATYLAERINEIHYGIAADDFAQYVKIALDEYKIETLQDLIDSVLDGKFADSLLKVLPSDSSSETVTLNRAFSLINQKIADNMDKAYQAIDATKKMFTDFGYGYTDAEVRYVEDGGKISADVEAVDDNGSRTLIFTFHNFGKGLAEIALALPLIEGFGEDSIEHIKGGNQAISRRSTAMGEGSIAGCKGYYITEIYYGDSSNNPQVRLSEIQPENGLRISSSILESSVGFVAPDYAGGSQFNITCGNHYFLIGTIKSISNDIITFTGDMTKFKAGLAQSVSDKVATLTNDIFKVNEDKVGFDDYTLSVPSAPTIGVVDVSELGSSEGKNTKAVGRFAHAEGRNVIAGESCAHAEGQGTVAGYNGHSEGCKTKATGHYAHSEGLDTIASGMGSHAEGDNTKAKGSWSHAEGIASEANGDNAHAEGDRTHASGESSHSEGTYFNDNGKYILTSASGKGSHAEGCGTTASGNNSHAEGVLTKATADNAHAEGMLSKASGNRSHAEGWSCEAKGQTAHAEGERCVASGQASHAGGYYTNAKELAQTAIGKFNSDNSNALFIVGNGTSDSNRSNAFEVLADGGVLANGLQVSNIAVGTFTSVCGGGNTLAFDFAPKFIIAVSVSSRSIFHWVWGMSVGSSDNEPIINVGSQSGDFNFVAIGGTEYSSGGDDSGSGGDDSGSGDNGGDDNGSGGDDSGSGDNGGDDSGSGDNGGDDSGSGDNGGDDSGSGGSTGIVPFTIKVDASDALLPFVDEHEGTVAVGTTWAEWCEEDNIRKTESGFPEGDYWINKEGYIYNTLYNYYVADSNNNRVEWNDVIVAGTYKNYVWD